VPIQLGSSRCPTHEHQGCDEKQTRAERDNRETVLSEFTAALDGVTRAFSEALPHSTAAANLPTPDRLRSSAAQDLAHVADAVDEGGIPPGQVAWLHHQALRDPPSRSAPARCPNLGVCPSCP
jgi:hypothetical protein